MNMSDLIADNKKGVAVYRVFLGICSVLGTLGITAVLGYVKSADSKLSRIDGDVSQIKWELPVIKETAKTDRSDMQKHFELINSKIENLRASGDEKGREIGKLQLEQALIKQKLQIP